MDDAEPLGIRHLRLTRDDFGLNFGLARGRLFYRASHALIYSMLSSWAGRSLRCRGIKHTEKVFGLLQDSRVDEEFILKLLPELPPGDSELYSHPSLGKFKHEFAALISPRVRELVDKLGLELIRYQDLDTDETQIF
jgi:hypothetical protein